jgi:hypothetical protein
MTIFGPELSVNPADPYGNLGSYGLPAGQTAQQFYGDPSLAAAGGGQTGWSALTMPQQMGVITQGLGAFGNLASLYSGFKALSLQKKQFKFAKDAWNKNYANQVKDYENSLKDRWTARNAGANARGRGFESMGSWVGSRALTGEVPGSHAGSAQEFYKRNSAQENRPIGG